MPYYRARTSYGSCWAWREPIVADHPGELKNEPEIAPSHCGRLAFLGIAALSPAQAAETVRVRGTVVGLDGSTLTVKTREGPNATLMLATGWKMAGVAKASVEDIKAGDFVGIASLPTAAGGDGALEVWCSRPR